MIGYSNLYRGYKYYYNGLLMMRLKYYGSRGCVIAISLGVGWGFAAAGV